MSDNVIALLLALIALASSLLDYLKKQWEEAHKVVTAVITSLFG